MLKKTIILLFLIIAVSSNAQEKTGIVSGTVINMMTGEPLPYANVTILGTRLGTITDANGKFNLESVPIGVINIQATYIGYSKEVKTDVMIMPFKPAVVEFKLEESAFRLDAVEVRPQYFAPIYDAPISTRSQSNEEIRRLPGGFQDVVRAISILPGVAQVSAGRNDLIIRGGAPSENLYVVENIEVPNINHFGTQGATGGPLSFINLDYVNETIFSTGGFGVKYGDKLSSSLNIDLKKGRQDEFGGNLTISASQFGLDMEGPFNEKGSYILSARRSYLDFIFRAADFSFVPEYWDFLTKVDYKLDNKNQITALGVLALDNVRFFNDDEDDKFDNSQVLSNDQNQFFGGVAWRRLFNKGFANFTIGQSYVNYNFVQNDSLLNPIFKNDALEHETSFKAEYTRQANPKLELTAGLLAKLIHTENNIILPPFETSFGQILTTEGLYDTTSYKGAAYIQGTQTIGKIRVNIGLRGDYFNMLNDNNFVFSPRLSSSFRLTDDLTLNGSVGRYYQSPSYVWLMVNSFNRDLDYVGADQAVSGFDYLLRDDTKLSVEGYYKKYFDYPVSLDRTYLVMANTGAGFGGKDDDFASFGFDDLVSEGEGRAYGVELFVQKKLSELPYYGILSISYNKSFFTPLDNVERPSSYDQRWIVNFGGGYQFNEKWEAGWKFRLATGRPYTPFDEQGIKDVNAYNAQRLDTNHSLDMRVERRWFFKNFALITFLDVQNVYDQKESGVPRWNEREEKVERDDSIGRLPTIGISLLF